MKKSYPRDKMPLDGTRYFHIKQPENHLKRRLLLMISTSSCAICLQCVSEIQKFGIPCLDAAILACEAISFGQQATLKPEYDNTLALPAINVLEQNGYVKTTETANSEIIFVPTCKPHKLDSGLIAYCWCIDEK